MNGRIHTNIHLFIHAIQSLFFSLFFLCMLVRILSSKIYFMCFFLASLLLALICYFYMVSELQGEQTFHLLHAHGIRASRFIKFYRVEEHIQSPIPLRRRAYLAYKIFSQFVLQVAEILFLSKSIQKYGLFISYNSYFLQLPRMESQNIHSNTQQMIIQSYSSFGE